MSPVVMYGGGPDLGRQVIEASAARSAVIIEGPNTNDLFHHEDRFVYVRELVALCQATQGRVPVVCSTRGVQQDPAPGQSLVRLRVPAADTPPGHALRQLRDQLYTLEDPVALIADFADLFLPQVAAGTPPTPDQQVLFETLATFPTDPGLGRHRLVVIVRADGLDPRLARFPGWVVVRAELPDENHRTLIAHRIVERHEHDPVAVAGLEPGLAPEHLARAAGGLTLDDLMRGALEAAEVGRSLTRRWVQETKVARLRQRNVEGLDVYPPGNGLADVAGLPQVRLFIKERLPVNTWPRSIVLAGPAGVGKTLVVRAIADVLGWPAVALGNVRSMWQGETERILRGFLSTARAMAPLVVHIDEVDQVLGQRDAGPSTDGGTGARILAELWTFLGDTNPDLPVVFVLTTNRCDLLDPATRSRSEVIPILHPTPSEQADMLTIACRTIGNPTTSAAASEVLNEAQLELDVVSGRMLVKVAQRADIVAGESPELGVDHLRAGFRELLERSDDIDDERMALKALSLASFTTYLPWVAAERLGEPVELLPYVAPLLDAGGRLDRKLLHERIAQLDGDAARRQAGRMV